METDRQDRMVGMLLLMPMSIPHNIKIVDNPHAGESPYKLEVVCSCQWQCLCDTMVNAEGAKSFHLKRHGVVEATVDGAEATTR